ncbi:MAG: hypothetical protein ACFFCD_15900 [Promethearchaeota archaeon]
MSSRLNQEILDLLKIEKGISVEKAAKILGRAPHSLRERLNKLLKRFILNKLQLQLFFKNKEIIVLITDLDSGNIVSSEDINLSTSVEFHHLVNTLKDVQTYKLYEFIRNNYLKTKKRECTLYEVLKNTGESISYDKASLNLLKLVNLDMIDIETGGVPSHQLRTIEKNQLKVAKKIVIHLKKLVEIRLIPTSVTMWTALQSYLRIIEDEEEKEKEYSCPLCESEPLTFIEHKDGSWTVYCQSSACMSSWYIENEAKKTLTRDDVFNLIIGKTSIADVHLITPSEEFIHNAEDALHKKGVVNLPYDIRILTVNGYFQIDVNIIYPRIEFPTIIDETQIEPLEDNVAQFGENSIHALQKISLLLELGFNQKIQKQNDALLFTRNAQTQNEALSTVKTLIEKYELLNISRGTFETKVREFRKGFPNHRFEMTIPKGAATRIGLKEGMKAKVQLQIIPEWR